jgi:hypothetical protein
MTHAGAPTIDSDHPSLPNQPFFAWLRTQTALFIGQILALLGAVYLIVALAYYFGGLHVPAGIITPETIATVVIYSHLLFLTVFIVWLIRVMEDNQHGAYRASRVYKRLVDGKFAVCNLSDAEHASFARDCSDQVRIFKLWFLGFWCAMLFLYIVFAVHPKFKEFYPPPVAGSLVDWHTLLFPFLTFMANNVSLFFIFCCFVVLYLPAGSRNARQLSEDLAITDEHLTAQASENRNRQRKLRRRFGALLVLFTLAFPAILWVRSVPLTTTNWSGYVAVFDALSGTLNAVVVALMIARLDSKLIGLPPWLISILYFYSGVQPLFVVFEQSVADFGAIRTAVLVIVFISKLYFFLIIVYSLQNGRLLNYFYCSPLLNQHIRAKGRNVEPVQQTSAEYVFLTNKLRALIPHSPKDWSLDYKSPRFLWLVHTLMRFTRWALNYLHGSRLHELPAKLKSVIASLDRLLGRFRSFAAKAQREWPLEVSKILGWIGIIYFATSLLYYAGALGSHSYSLLFSADLRLAMVYVHLLLLVAIISVVLLAPKRRWGVGGEKGTATRGASTSQGEPTVLLLNAENRLRQFQRFFLLFWCVMFAFYVAFAVKQYGDPWISPLSVMSPLVPLNMPAEPLSTKVIVTLEPVAKQSDADHDSSSLHASAVVEEPTPVIQKPSATPERSAQEEESQARARRDSTWSTGYSIVAFLLNNLMVLFIFMCFSVLYLSVDDRYGAQKYTSLLYCAILTSILLTVIVPLLLFSFDRNTAALANPAVAATVIAVVGGTLNAVAFALLIARLDSRLIRLPSSVISVLYAYSALQSLFVVFEQGAPVFRAIETSALLAAFIFKICALLIILHALRSGRLQDHLLEFPFLNRIVNSIFDNQFEIRMYRTEKQFKYSIFREDKEVYTTEDLHLTRAACDTAVSDLIKSMQKEDNYLKPPPVQGTYWLQVKKASDEENKPPEVICESKGLRSALEVEDLMKESIEMVPNCKYNRD